VQPGIKVGLVTYLPARTIIDKPFVVDLHLRRSLGAIIVFGCTGKLIALGGSLQLVDGLDTNFANEGAVPHDKGVVFHHQSALDSLQTAPGEVLAAKVQVMSRLVVVEIAQLPEYIGGTRDVFSRLRYRQREGDEEKIREKQIGLHDRLGLTEERFGLASSDLL
jgi:hypothetical protein